MAFNVHPSIACDSGVLNWVFDTDSITGCSALESVGANNEGTKERKATRFIVGSDGFDDTPSRNHDLCTKGPD